MKCAAFFSEGLTQVLYAPQFNLLDAAKRGVPNGIPFVLINIVDLPSRETRSEWSFDYLKPDGFGEAA